MCIWLGMLIVGIAVVGAVTTNIAQYQLYELTAGTKVVESLNDPSIMPVLKFPSKLFILSWCLNFIVQVMPIRLIHPKTRLFTPKGFTSLTLNT
jgi:hypothetical protein